MLISVSAGLLKGITGSDLPENPWVLPVLGSTYVGPTFQGTHGVIWVGVEGFDKIFEDILTANETSVSGLAY